MYLCSLSSHLIPYTPLPVSFFPRLPELPLVLASPAPSSTGTSTTLLLLLRSFCRPAMELNNISSYFRVPLSPDFNIGLYSLISLIHFFSLRLSLYLLLLTAHLSISLIRCCYLPVVVHGPYILQRKRSSLPSPVCCSSWWALPASSTMLSVSVSPGPLAGVSSRPPPSPAISTVLRTSANIVTL